MSQICLMTSSFLIISLEGKSRVCEWWATCSPINYLLPVYVKSFKSPSFWKVSLNKKDLSTILSIEMFHNSLFHLMCCSLMIRVVSRIYFQFYILAWKFRNVLDCFYIKFRLVKYISSRFFLYTCLLSCLHNSNKIYNSSLDMSYSIYCYDVTLE